MYIRVSATAYLYSHLTKPELKFKFPSDITSKRLTTRSQTDCSVKQENKTKAHHFVNSLGEHIRKYLNLGVKLLENM